MILVCNMLYHSMDYGSAFDNDNLYPNLGVEYKTTCIIVQIGNGAAGCVQSYNIYYNIFVLSLRLFLTVCTKCWKQTICFPKKNSPHPSKWCDITRKT